MLNTRGNRVKSKFKDLSFFFKENKTFIIMFTASLFVYSLWIIAFWPANMSPDSMAFWSQATTFKFDNLHPYLFSLFLSFLNLLWKNPALLIILQTVFFSFLISYFFQYLLKNGANKLITSLSFASLLLFLPISLYNTMFWNDILYTYLILFISILFVKNNFKLYEEKNLQLPTLFFIAILVVTIASFRHNGIIYLTLIPAVYYFYKLISLKKALLFFSGILILFIFQAAPLSKYLKVVDNSKLLPEIPKAKTIGSAMKSGIVFNPADQNFLLQIAPKTVWDNYVCQNDYGLFWDERFDKKLLESEQGKAQWNRIFFWTITNHPDAFIKDRVCLAVNLLAGQNMFFLGIANESEQNLGPITQPLHKQLTKVVEWTGGKPQRFIIWSPAIFIICHSAAAVFTLRKKLYVTFGYILINITNIGLIFLITSSAEYRYLYSIVPALFLLPSLLSTEIYKQTRKSKEEQLIMIGKLD